MRESASTLVALQQRIAKQTRHCGSNDSTIVKTEHPQLDAYLDGGIRRGRLHEIFAENADDSGSASGFAAMLGLRMQQDGKPLLWVRTQEAVRRGGQFHAAGFAELGGNPNDILLSTVPDIQALLRASVDALRCNGLGAVIIECCRNSALLDLTTSRRLTLAAERSGVTALMLRFNASPMPSTADTRWSVCAAPSQALEANAPGRPAFDLTLLRRRAGPSGRSWRMEWDRDRRRFAEAARKPEQRQALSGAVVSVPAAQPTEDLHARPLSLSA